MLRWIRRAGLAQLVAWVSFGAAVTLVGLPLWIPSPVTMVALGIFRR